LKDNRDPQLLGEQLLAKDTLWHRKSGVDCDPHPGSLSGVYDAYGSSLERVPDYHSDHMSSDPAEHHSKTPQTEDLQ